MSQFKHYAPVSDKQLGFYIDSSRCSGCKACRWRAKIKTTLRSDVVSVAFMKSMAGISSQPGRAASATMCLPTRSLFPVTTVQTQSALKTVRPRRCTSVRETALCALILISASAAATARGLALTARHSSTSRPGRCPNVISAWISEGEGRAARLCGNLSTRSD